MTNSTNGILPVLPSVLPPHVTVSAFADISDRYQHAK